MFDHRDIDTIRKFILDEQRMREYVFRSKPAQQRDKKLQACDDALAALRRIETRLAGIQPALLDLE